MIDKDWYNEITNIKIGNDKKWIYDYNDYTSSPSYYDNSAVQTEIIKKLEKRNRSLEHQIDILKDVLYSQLDSMKIILLDPEKLEKYKELEEAYNQLIMLARLLYGEQMETILEIRKLSGK